MKTNPIKKALKLATADSRPPHHRMPTATDLQEIVDHVGLPAFEHLISSKAAIYIFKDPEAPGKDETNSHPVYPHNTLEAGIIIGTHIVFLHLYKPHQSIFPMSMEVSFAFTNDYKRRNGNIYTKIRKIKYISDKQIDTTNLKFLLTLRRFIQLIPKTTQITIFYTSAQRGRVYQKALRKCPNVHLKWAHKVAKF